MKKFITVLCAFAFASASLSAQNVDTVKVSKHGNDTIVVIVKDERAKKHVVRNVKSGVENREKSPYMVNVGYKRGYRANIELSSVLTQQLGIASSHGFSFGNGLYVGGGAGFAAEFIPDFDAVPAYYVPVFADVKYSFMKTLATPYVSLKGGMVADITNKGLKTFVNPAVGVDIARFSISVGYEYQLGFWGHNNGVNNHKATVGVAYTF